LALLFLSAGQKLSAATRIKTVEYNFGSRYSTSNLASGTAWTPPTITVHLPESGVVIRNAYLELEALASVSTTLSDLQIRFNTGGTASTLVFDGAGTYITQTGELFRVAAKADATAQVTAWSNQTYSASVTLTGPSSNMHALKLYVTYEYDDTSATQVKTVRFPAYYASNVTSAQSQLTGGSTTAFTYNAEIADSGVAVQQQWFEIRGQRQSNSSTADGNLRCRIGSDTTEPVLFFEGAGTVTYDFLYLTQAQTSVPGFAANTSQTLNIVSGGNANITVLNGECVVTYTFNGNSATKTKTVAYFLGQSPGAAAAGNILQDLFLLEGNITLKRLYARISSTFDVATLTNFVLDSAVAGQSVTQRSYSTLGQAATISGYSFLHDLTEQAGSWVNGSSVTLSYPAQTGRGGTGVELIATYDYTNEGAFTESYSVFAGQSSQQTTTSQAQNFTVYFPTATTPLGTKTLRSAYLQDRFNNSQAAGADRDTLINVGGTNSQTVDHQHPAEAFTATVLYTSTNQVTPTNAVTYTGNHDVTSTDRAVFSNKAVVSYTYFPPPRPPTGLTPYKSDGTTVVSTGQWINDGTLVFKFSMDAPPLADTLTPEIEIKPVGQAFDGTGTQTGVAQAYSGSVLTGSVTVSGLSTNTTYHWQARVQGTGGNGAWVSYGGNAESASDVGIDLTSAPAPAMTAISPIQDARLSTGTLVLDFENVSDGAGSGVQNYFVQVSTDINFGVLSFSSSPTDSQASVTDLSQDFYYWRGRTVDVAGNTGDYSSPKTFRVDLTTPTVSDLQSGDDIWRSAAGTTYDVDFYDLGGSSLSYVQYRVFSGPGQTGTLLKDWTTLALGIGATYYTADWPVDFAALQETSGNYVSVRAVDFSTHTAAAVDVFYVRKDTTPPSVPLLSSPADNVNLNSGNILFDWTDSTDASSLVADYVLEVATDPAFTAGSIVFSSSTALSQASTATLAQGFYYWHVRARDNAGNSSSNAVLRTLRVDLTTPTVSDLQAGDDAWRNAAGATYDVDFYDLGGSSLSYAQYRIFSAPDQSGTLLKDWTAIALGIGATHYTADWPVDFAACREGTNYVSVRAVDLSTNTSTYADVFHVRKDTTSPPTPTLLSPADNVQNNHGNISFDWSDVSDGASGPADYVLEVSTRDDFGILSFSSSPIVSQASTTSLSTGLYYWRVRARDNAGNYSADTSTFSFRVDRASPAVTDPVPGDDTVWRSANPGAVYNVDFADTGGSRLARFEVKASTLPGGMEPSLVGYTTVVSDINADSYSMDWALPVLFFNALVSHATNYITVRAFDTVGNISAESTDVFFVLKDTVPPATPSPLSPADGSVTKDPRPAFDWSDAPDVPSGVDHYELQVSTDPAFGTLSYSPSPAVSQATPAADLPTATYYWRVRAVDKAGNAGDYSSPSYEILVDTIAPVIQDSQADVAAFLNAPGASFNVDFADAGGALLDTAEYRITLGPNQTGTVRKEWTPIFVGLHLAAYETDWQVDFSALEEGETTNYVSVRVWDTAGTTTTLNDVFYVNKDVSLPSVIDQQTGDDTWRTADPGAIYDVDFRDLVSRLDRAEYRVTSLSGGGGTEIIPWTTLFGPNHGSTEYTTDWGIDFAALSQGQNHVSVHVWDKAGNDRTFTDVFYVRKDTQAPTLVDNQPDDDTWRTANTGSYDVDFHDDPGGSLLEKFQIRASTVAGGTGPFAPDWSDVATGLGAADYTANWSLPSGVFETLPPGKNYISLRAFDAAGNAGAVLTDGFYILKDTSPPQIADAQSGDDAWRRFGGTAYDVDFHDPDSLLTQAQYTVWTGPALTGTEKIPGRPFSLPPGRPPTRRTGPSTSTAWPRASITSRCASTTWPGQRRPRKTSSM